MRKFMNDKDYKTTRLQDYKLRLLTFVFSLLSLSFAVSSCSTQRNLDKSNLKPLNANNIIREIEDNQFEFDNLEARIGISVKGDNKLGLKGQMRMQKDSTIWISLSLKVGIEVGRIMITQDSIKYINRNTRTYLAESLEYFENKLPIVPSLQFIQDLLVGNDTQNTRSDRCKASTDNGHYKLEISNKNTSLIKDVWVNSSTFRINEFMLKESREGYYSIVMKYDDFKNINGKLLPSRIIFEINEASEDYKTTRLQDYKFCVEINYSDIKTGEELSFPFNVSPKFEQIYLW